MNLTKTNYKGGLSRLSEEQLNVLSLELEENTYKKQALVPADADPEEQEWFLSCFKEFMEKKSEKDAVFFADAAHPT